jgi:alpha-1,2-mannosyltransferase
VLAILLAAGCVWWSFRLPILRDLRLAVLLAATVLAAPHVTNYDTVMLVIAATLLFARALDDGLHRGEVMVPVSVWMIQLFNPPSAFRLGLITPLLTCGLIACTVARARADSVMPGPRPRSWTNRPVDAP